MTLEQKSVEIMKQCHKFEDCSAPFCPLDLLQDSRTRLSGEPKCTLSKVRRLKIGKDLPRGGMTKREWSAKLKWDAMSDDARALETARIRGVLRSEHTKKGVKIKKSSKVA